MTSAAEFAEFAQTHLPQPFADRWISLLRPAAVFPGDPDTPAGPGLRSGGEPLLPEELDWPMFDERIPMTFIAELDCAALAGVGAPEGMPQNGHLLFFCVDYQYETEDPNDDWSNRTTPWTAGSVIYVPEGTVRRERRTPQGLEALEPELRPAQAASTPPSLSAEFAERYFGPEAPAMVERHMEAIRFGRKPNDADACPLWASEFELGLHKLRCYVQSGGHPYSVQDSVELEAARCALRRNSEVEPSEQEVLDEAQHWRLLLQDAVDEFGIMIGYWLLREDDLAAGRFDRAYFDMQS